MTLESSPASEVPGTSVPRPVVELRTATTLTLDVAQSNRYHATLTDDWTIVHVFGGVSMYCLLRAMSEHLDRDELEVQQMTALFLAPVPAGAVVADVDVLRNGRSTAQVSADLRTPGAPTSLVRAHAVFGTPDRAPEAGMSLVCPLVPPPAQLVTRPHSADHHFPMGDRTEWRPIDRQSTGPEKLAWERLREGVVHREALVIHGDILGAAVEAVSPSFILSLEISIRFIRTPTTPWVLQHAQVSHLSDGYTTGPASLWDEEGSLCAIVNQTALVRPSPQA